MRCGTAARVGCTPRGVSRCNVRAPDGDGPHTGALTCRGGGRWVLLRLSRSAPVHPCRKRVGRWLQESARREPIDQLLPNALAGVVLKLLRPLVDEEVAGVDEEVRVDVRRRLRV